MLGLLLKPNKEQKELLQALRDLQTLRVSSRGGMSIDSQEILSNKNFIAASEKAKKIVAGE